jgi:C-terminal processing protease CtpA/Prc
MKIVRHFIYGIAIFISVPFISIAQKIPPPLPKIAPDLLRQDFSLLQKILEANHPSLYWYVSKQELDSSFQNGINSITDSLDEWQFKNRVASVISQIRCGHTTVRFSKAYSKKAAQYRYPQFPLLLKAWGDSLVVLNSAIPRDSIFKRGTIITSINGRTNRQILDTLFQFISTDGYSDNYKNQVVSGNFPAWYKTIFGLDSSYQIKYINPKGAESIAVVKNVNPLLDTGKRQIRIPVLAAKKPTRKELRKAALLAKRSLTIDTALHTAFMNLSTFGGSGLRSFFRRSFKKVQEQNIPNLVIDLRTNGGGKVSNSILLTKYLADHPFKVGDSVVAISRKFAYGQYIHPSLIYWLAMNFGAHKMEDGLIHFRYFEKKYFQPKEKLHFNGSIYLVEGGYSFSATTMFLSQMKGQSNVKILGEESGGGYYGNSAMHIPNIILSNSGLQISLPMYKLVINAQHPKGHGVMPDIPIPPSSEAIKKGVDLKMVIIKELLQHKATG